MKLSDRLASERNRSEDINACVIITTVPITKLFACGGGGTYVRVISEGSQEHALWYCSALEVPGSGESRVRIFCLQEQIKDIIICAPGGRSHDI